MDRQAFQVFIIIIVLCFFTHSYGQTSEDCLSCHDDSELTDESGRDVHVDRKGLSASIHRDLECVDCHDQPADYDDLPHFSTGT